MRRLPRGARFRREETPRGSGQGAVREVPRRPLAGSRRRGVGGGPPGARRRLLRLPSPARGPGRRHAQEASRRALCFECHDAFVPPRPTRAARCTSPSPRGGARAVTPPTVRRCRSCSWRPPIANSASRATRIRRSIPRGRTGRCRTRRSTTAVQPATGRTSPRRRGFWRSRSARCAPGVTRTRISTATGTPGQSPHAPVATGMCASCHGVHGAAQKVLLKKSEYEICGTCHTEVHQRHQVVELDAEHGTAGERHGHAAAGVSGPEERRQARVRRVSSCRTARKISSCGMPRTWRASAPAVTRCSGSGRARPRGLASAVC